jgi:hypothetical protein
MNKILYSDNEGVYRLIDFNQSHNELLFRKHKSKDNEFNIDILFKGVYSLNLTIMYKSISISIVDRQLGQTCNNLADRQFIFKITDKSNAECYIDAAAFGIFRNKLDYNVSSLGDYTWSNENESIYWSSEDMEIDDGNASK